MNGNTTTTTNNNGFGIEQVLITPAQAGKMLGLNGITVRKLVIEGVLNVPHLMSGNRLKIFYAPIEEICRTGEYKGKPVMIGGMSE